MGGGSYPSAEVQSVYSTAPADWASQIHVPQLFQLPCNVKVLARFLSILLSGHPGRESPRFGKLSFFVDCNKV